jgi:cytochrome c-type biogenesis protein CcmH/NrfG/predicted regulator of Ras-like GTPase activity (Roadblock/LC7/MglB family)
VQLFQKLKIAKELKRLEQRARREPSTSTFVDLGQVCINLEKHDRALQAAEDGLRLFPQSQELLQLRDCARRSLVKGRIQELLGKLRKAPDPESFAELAGLHLELNDAAALRGTCEEWGVRFPADTGPWLLLGQAHLTAFYRDLKAREGIQAMECLEHALAIDPGEPRALRMLGEVLVRIGAVGLGREHLARLRSIGEADGETRALLAQTAALCDQGSDSAALFQRAQVTGALANPPCSEHAAAGGEEGIGRIRDALAQIAELPGVQKAAYIKGSRALVKGDIVDGRDVFLRVVRVVAKAAQRFSRRMDFGDFNKGVLDGHFGRICICSYGDVVAAVQAETGLRVDRVLADLQELVAGSLYATGVQSR